MLFTYTSCPHCGGLTACYCYTPGRQISDLYADKLDAVQNGLGQYAILDITDSIWTALVREDPC
jgi:hypothetical protein